MTAVFDAAYVRPRAGLGDVPARLLTEDCTIAYMGASVTAQRDGFRPRLHGLLCRHTGRGHRAVNAALGATGAITGVFLMEDFVLPHRPDLALVEYATSDVVGTTPPAHLGPVLEGIVGKLRDVGCEPCFLYLHRSDVDLGRTDVVATYESVADRHGVPSVNVADWMREEIARGRLDEGAILRDVVHTTGFGSTVTAEAISRGLRQIQPTQRAGAGPLRDDAFRGARVESPASLLTGGGPFAEGRFRLTYPFLELDRGRELRLRARGEVVGLLVVLGPHSGYLEVTAAGETVEYLLWDDECSYERLGSVVFDPFAPAGCELRLRVSNRAVDRSASRRPVEAGEASRTRLKLVGLMVRP